jgi:glycosyltransferase involved in cell wall biosynthesis
MVSVALPRGANIEEQATAVEKSVRPALDASRDPIFVHSLFRSGSTYVFNVFRRAHDSEGPLYTAFQEPIHELVYEAANRPERLLIDTGRGTKQRLLRHPELDAPYWQELYEIHDAWRRIFAEEIVYSDYFGGYAPEKTAGYLAAIIAGAPRRPFIQECRTSLRIERLKSALGGLHIHLWRNPWDQWWSFKSDEYFDTALQLILNAPQCPPAIARLKRAITFPAVAGATPRGQFDFYARRRPTAEASYLTFFMLWTLALEHGRRAADIDINVDLLSTSAEYRRSVEAKLAGAGIKNLDFSDARAPQAFYGEADVAFFRPLEKRVREMLTQSDYQAATLDVLDEIRAEAAPAARRDGLERELARLREVVRRVETREAQLLAHHVSESDAARQVRLELDSARHMAAEATRQHQQEIAAVHASTSWRATAPLRFIKRALKRLASGSWAWITLRPGSRPRRVARRAFVNFADYLTVRPRIAALARQGLAYFTWLETRLPSGIDQLLYADIARARSITENATNLLLETQSVRLAFKRLLQARANQCLPAVAKRREGNRLRLAYVSPLPPERTGIADYSAELLPALARYYDIDVIVAQASVMDRWIEDNCTVRDLNWFERHAHYYDRIIYHIGNNSLFHRHMFPLLEVHPGVVVLHEFYLSHAIAFLELNAGRDGYWTRALYDSHGYEAVRARFIPHNLANTIVKYPANLGILQQAQGVIVHSEFSRQLARCFYGNNFADDWAVVPHMRCLPIVGDRQAVREALGFAESDFLLCSFGILGEAKLNHRLLEAWLASALADDPDCHLVFVGEALSHEYDVALRNTINNSSAEDRIRITGFASPELYQKYLSVADAAVQLRTQSRGETSGTVFDCMGHAIPTLVNAHGSIAELPEDCVFMLPNEFTDGELVAALERLRSEPARGAARGKRAQNFVKDNLSPRLVADQYHDAIENFARRAGPLFNVRILSANAAGMMHPPADDRAWLICARGLAERCSIKKAARQLLIDVSALSQEDLKTGIQRVVRAQLLGLLDSPPTGFRVEPVRLCKTLGEWRYHYARRYMSKLISIPQGLLEDDPVEIAEGDILYVPDLHTDGVSHATESGLYAAWRARGVQINFLIHDILPLIIPEYFPTFAEDTHLKWLASMAESADRLICISHAVAEETKGWLKSYRPAASPKLEIAVSHHGADVDASGPSKGLPLDAKVVLESLLSRPTFLMVGTIEPRKGYLQTLAALEQLWREGTDVNLVIVGPEGWKSLPHNLRRNIPEIVETLRSHPKYGNRLFWLQGISDEYLEKIYAASTCLIAASEGEGFGLPLIEAARHKVPILARDIPVFREVAGHHAAYFRGKQPSDLAHAIRNWLMLLAAREHPKSDTMPWLTWAESVERLKAILLRGEGVGAFHTDRILELHGTIS